MENIMLEDLTTIFREYPEYSSNQPEKMLNGKRFIDYRFLAEIDILFMTATLGRTIFGTNFDISNQDQLNQIIINNLGYAGIINKKGEILYNRNTNPVISSHVTRSKENVTALYKVIGNDTFYSNAEYAVKTIPQKKATPIQWLKMLEKNGGLKAGEDQWIELRSFLLSSQQPVITKNEILSYIDSHEIILQERLLKGSKFRNKYLSTPGLIDKKEIIFWTNNTEMWNPEDIEHFGKITHGKTIAWGRFGEISSNGERCLVIDEIQSKRHQARRSDKSIPAAPFEKNWHEIVMKRLLRYAADNEYERICWTSGQQQIERYQLAQKTYDIIYSPQYPDRYPGKLILSPSVRKNSKIFNIKDFNHLEMIIGSDNAKQINDGTFSLKGVKIQEGHGLIEFYDRILPQFINKYCKKWKQNTELIQVAGQTMHSLAITDQMKENLKQGQPLFYFAGENGARNLDNTESRNTRLDQLSIAKTMETNGKDAKLIKQITGWERGKDNKWKYETVDPEIKEDLICKMFDFHLKNDERKIRLTDLVDSPDLFNSYPKLNEYVVYAKKTDIPGCLAYNNHTEKEIVIDTKLDPTINDNWIKEDQEYLLEFKNKSPEEILSYESNYNERVSDVIEFLETDIKDHNKNRQSQIIKIKGLIFHELQHSIQRIEGFAEECDPEIFKQRIKSIYKEIVSCTDGAFSNHDILSPTGISTKLNSKIPYTEITYKKGYKPKLDHIAKEYGYNDIDDLLSNIEKESAYIYNNLAGEVEARNVQNRINMSLEERRETLACETEDVTEKGQISKQPITYINVLKKIEELGSIFDQNINVINDRSELPENLRIHMKDSGRYPGIFDTTTKQVFIIVSDIKSPIEVEMVLKHEILGHRGIRALKKEKLNSFLDKVFENMPESDKRQYQKQNPNKYIATEEYIADQAMYHQDQPPFQKIKAIFRECLRSWGFSIKFSDNDINYILTCGKKALQKQIKQNSPKVGSQNNKEKNKAKKGRKI